MRLFKSKEDKQRVEEARVAFDQFVSAASSAAPADAVALARQFRASPVTAALSEKERDERSRTAFRTYAENLLVDDHLTAEEEEAFGEVAEALGVEQQALQHEYGDVMEQLVVAKLNNGRMEPMADPRIMAKPGESVYLEIGAALLKEVAVREWQAGSGGISFRIAKGMRYHTGQTRGRSVVVGTEIQMADTGMLAVTDKRIAYMGERKSMEFPLAKLMNLDVFEDGVRIHSSNRQNAPTFQLQAHTSDVFAATVNAVMQTEI
jgi:hypothetical protein